MNLLVYLMFFELQACPISLSCGDYLQNHCTLVKIAAIELCVRSSEFFTGTLSVSGVTVGPKIYFLACGGEAVRASTPLSSTLTAAATTVNTTIPSHHNDVSPDEASILLMLLGKI